MQIRPFGDADYPAYVEILNTAHPESPRSESDVRHFDSTRGPGEVQERFLFEAGGLLIGVVSYEFPRQYPAPGRLEVQYRLRPGHEHLAGTLWEFLLGQMAPLQPTSLVTRVREDWQEMSFYLSRGFREWDRMWASALDLTSFDPAPLQARAEGAGTAGITVTTLADRPYTDEAYLRRHYDLICALLSDVPSADPVIPWPFEVWLERTVKNPTLLPAGYFIALDGDEEIGVSQLWGSSRPQTLQTGLTGVRKEYRRRGIALTLKLRAVAYATAQGYRYVRTGNHSINRPMLAINEAMGFVREPAWVHLIKELNG